jgi:hypothetical protein
MPSFSARARRSSLILIAVLVLAFLATLWTAPRWIAGSLPVNRYS